MAKISIKATDISGETIGIGDRTTTKIRFKSLEVSSEGLGINESLGMVMALMPGKISTEVPVAADTAQEPRKVRK